MPVRIAQQKRSAAFIDLGLMEYGRALDRQIKTVQSKINEPRTADHLFFVEHPSVFTLGKRGGLENLVVSEEFLAKQGVNVIQTDRGGNITFHGPGQAVLYPVIDLEKNKIAVKDFVFGLEEIMMKTARDFGVSADRDDRNHGVWVNNAKIGSVGISVKKGVSFHGLAMNISLDLTPFTWINPCGLSNVSMTSIQQELPCKSEMTLMTDIKDAFVTYFSDLFSYTIHSR